MMNRADASHRGFSGNPGGKKRAKPSDPPPDQPEVAQPVNTERERDGRFASGNPGKPKGARHKTTLAMEALLEGEAEAISRKAIEMAKAGDHVALRLCFDRLLPPKKERLIELDIPKITAAKDLVDALLSWVGVSNPIAFRSSQRAGLVGMAMPCSSRSRTRACSKTRRMAGGTASGRPRAWRATRGG